MKIQSAENVTADESDMVLTLNVPQSAIIRYSDTEQISFGYNDINVAALQ